MATGETSRFPTTPAATLEEVWRIFDPLLAVDPESEFYVERMDHRLQQLTFELEHADAPLHAFLCGHRGSGKTTELWRLQARPAIREVYLPVYLTAQDFGKEIVHLTHDALLVEIGLALTEVGEEHGMDPGLAEELDRWGRSVVKTSLHEEGVDAEAGGRGSVWLAYFRASLKSRRHWSVEQRLALEPRISDLVDLVNRMALDLQARIVKRVLVIVDDLEKGESDAHREMHGRLFQDNYETLVEPAFSLVYTLPIYFRALPGNRIPNDELYAFSAIRLYGREEKKELRPALQRDGDGYRLMRDFVERRVVETAVVFASDAVLDELLLIGGGLFRETARAVRDAAYYALVDGVERITSEHAGRVFDQVKKEYQPLVRGEAVSVLRQVLASEEGWVPKVEEFLQSRAVVEYENGDLWLDVRYVLKKYLQRLENGS